MPLSAADLIPDEPLQPTLGNRISNDDDLLHHRVIARRIAELSSESNGKVNIALFGPWGAGKSSFNALLAEELNSIDATIKHITYDAWKNAGEGFQANFLNNLAAQIPKADPEIAERLFEASTTVKIPFQKKRSRLDKFKWVATWALGPILGIAVGLPLLGTALGALLTPDQGDFFTAFRVNLLGWSGVAASGTFLISILLILLEVTKINVQRAAPSYVSQFSGLFDSLISAGKHSKYVIFIDELDRCSPADVMKTLEGLRTFLGHSQCVFVVAFDREAIASTIAAHPGREIPKNSTSPYYQTSGEYLDKIFQYQVSLPPQPTHTFRHLATSLVKERGGVWAELRSSDARRFERVITLLSPMHLRSPRRTKVLLNDFAVNARIYESLGFAWVERAEEIAILTVMQTEFPRLAADLEMEPGLMHFLMSKEKPRRPELMVLLAKYQPNLTSSRGRGSNEPSDDQLADGSLDNIVGTENVQEVVGELREHLLRYLRRLQDMGAPVPQADLIMMHSGGDLMSFEDPGIYNILQSASDMPREEVLAGLEEATPKDLTETIDYLLRNVESETEEQAKGIYTLVASIVAQSNSVNEAQASAMLSNIEARRERLDAVAVHGYGIALTKNFNEETLVFLLEQARGINDLSGLERLTMTLCQALDEAQWLGAREPIAGHVLPLVADIPAASAAFIARLGDVNETLSGSQIVTLSAALSTEVPSELREESDVESLPEEEKKERARLVDDFEAELTSKHRAAEVLFGVWELLLPEAAVRAALLRVLRGTTGEQDSLLDYHDRLVDSEAAHGNATGVNTWLLEAIAEVPGYRTDGWADRLIEGSVVEAELKIKAMAREVHRATSGRNTLEVGRAVKNALSIARLPSPEINDVNLLQRVRDFVESDWEEYDDFHLEIGLGLLSVIQAASAAEIEIASMRLQFLTGAVFAAQLDNASTADISAAVQRLKPEEVSRFIEDLISASKPWSEDHQERGIEVALKAQIHARSVGSNYIPLGADVIGSVVDEAIRAILATYWLQTVPGLEEVKSLDSVGSIPPAAWYGYSEAQDPLVRNELWDFVRGSGAFTDRELVLERIAAPGMPAAAYQGASNRAKDAPNIEQRRELITEFLTLPANHLGATSARNIVVAMADDSYSTELRQGIRILRAYVKYLSDNQKKLLRAPIGRWIGEGKDPIGPANAKWLSSNGLVSAPKNLFGARRKQK